MLNPSPSSKFLSHVVREEKLSYDTAHCGTVALNFHPYCVCVDHEFLQLDFKQRVNYCKLFLDFVEKDPYKLYEIVYSDEVWFSLLKCMNGDNNRMWSTINWHVRLEAHLHLLKMRVWCGISGYHVIGPIFFFFLETIISVVYLEIIDQFIALLPNHQCYCFFQ